MVVIQFAVVYDLIYHCCFCNASISLEYLHLLLLVNQDSFNLLFASLTYVLTNCCQLSRTSCNFELMNLASAPRVELGSHESLAYHLQRLFISLCV
jgi:hypothetical protein